MSLCCWANICSTLLTNSAFITVLYLESNPTGSQHLVKADTHSHNVVLSSTEFLVLYYLTFMDNLHGCHKTHSVKYGNDGFEGLDHEGVMSKSTALLAALNGREEVF